MWGDDAPVVVPIPADIAGSRLRARRKRCECEQQYDFAHGPRTCSCCLSPWIDLDFKAKGMRQFNVLQRPVRVR